MVIRDRKGTLTAAPCRRWMSEILEIVIPHNTERRPQMRQKVLMIALGLILAASMAATLTAQEDNNQKDQKYKHHYSKDLFNEADANADGFVSWSEAKNSSRDIERDMQGRKRFNSADLDNDGRLSVQEARKYRGFEARHRDEGIAKTKGRKGSGNGNSSGVGPAANAGKGVVEHTTSRKKTIRTTDKERVVNKRLNKKQNALDKRNRRKRHVHGNTNEAGQ